MTKDAMACAPPSRRALAKDETRRRLIAAAKHVVIERGYDAASLRQVAAAAKLSTGAVFANFADKSELFTEVILTEHKLLVDRMRPAPGSQDSPRSILLSMLSEGYDLHFEQLPLVKTELIFSWLSNCELEQRWRSGVDLILAGIVDVLEQGVSAGQLSASIDVRLVAAMIWESYLSNFRQVIFGGWTLEAVHKRMADQIDILLASASADAVCGRQAMRPDDRSPAKASISENLVEV
jgi:AcrR family transcriptional regulator